MTDQLMKGVQKGRGTYGRPKDPAASGLSECKEKQENGGMKVTELI
jgi:hypothetical protein